MKPVFEKLSRMIPRAGKPGLAAEVKQITPSVKPPIPLPMFYMLSHLEEDGPVRLDGVKLGICEVMGLELDEPRLGSFAGALNALDFPVQLLVRQHPPVLDSLRDALRETQPEGLPPKTKEAADSLRGLLKDLESREGVLDRRFYVVCRHDRADDMASLLSRVGLFVQPLRGRTLRMFILACTLGGSPRDMEEDEPVEVEINRRDLRIGSRLTRSLHLGRWPRTLVPGFLQALMNSGIPMDISVHLAPIPADQAARTLEWQKVRFESARSMSFRKGRSLSPEAGDSPGGRHPPQGRGAEGQGAAVPLLPLSNSSCR